MSHPGRRPGPRSAGPLATLLLLATAAPAAAHEGVTGAADAMQDYGVLLFLAATVLIGAGVLAWTTLSPAPEEELEEPAAEAAEA